MDLTVIIVNYNVRHFLEQCLNSVIKASQNNSCEIFVVDNNSTDGSCQMVISQFPEVKLIRNLNNVGFSTANNQAIRLSTGEYVLLLNPDTLVEEDSFTKCLAFMTEHTDAGALGVKMINGNGRLLPESKRAMPTPGTAFFKMSGLSFLFPRSQIFNRYYLGHLDSSATAETEIIAGAFMFIRKEALDKTGLLDEAFFMYGEDIDLSYRILKAGYKNYYFPEVRIIHYKGESTRKGNINYVVQFYKAMLIFSKKHFTENGNSGRLFFIRIAVYFWAFVAVLKNFLLKFIRLGSQIQAGISGSGMAGYLFIKPKRAVIVSDREGFINLKNLIEVSRVHSNVIGRVSIKSEDTGNELLGNIEKISEVVRNCRINEVIFSSRELSVSRIISSMDHLSESNVTIKIAPIGENLIIGSKSIN